MKNKKIILLVILIISALLIFNSIFIIIKQNEKNKLNKNKQENLVVLEKVKNIVNNKNLKIRQTNDLDDIVTYNIYDKTKLKYTIKINKKTYKSEINYTR